MLSMPDGLPQLCFFGRAAIHRTKVAYGTYYYIEACLFNSRLEIMISVLNGR